MLMSSERHCNSLDQETRGRCFHVMDRDEIEPFEDNTRFLGLESSDEVHAELRALKKSYLEIVSNIGKKFKNMTTLELTMLCLTLENHLMLF